MVLLDNHQPPGGLILRLSDSKALAIPTKPLYLPWDSFKHFHIKFFTVQPAKMAPHTSRPSLLEEMLVINNLTQDLPSALKEYKAQREEVSSPSIAGTCIPYS